MDSVARLAEHARAEPTHNRHTVDARRFWILQIAGWTLFGAVMLVWGLQYWNSQDAVINKLILVTTGIALTLALRSLYRRVFITGAGMIPIGAAVVGASFMGAALWYELEMALFQIYLSGKGGLFSVNLLPIPIGMWLFYGFVLLAWSLCYFAIHTREQAVAQETRALRAEAMAQQARLQALRAQLEPHFLFNTLNCISTLIIDQKPETAALMLSRLSDFLRMTLEAGEISEVSLAEELEFVRRYLEIQQLRFGDRLEVKIEAEPQAMSVRLPVLIIQPLIENAVKHGILSNESGGTILVNAARNNGKLHLSVQDTGNGCDAESRVGIGLSNISARLREMYGDKARLQLRTANGGGTLASLEIPVRT
jgi:two-component system, LytTR family, sensor kinase